MRISLRVNKTRSIISFAQPCICHPDAPAVIICRKIISSLITTLLNYRTAITVRSDFSVINGFPEVYRGYGISTARISGGERVVTGLGETQHIASSAADNATTSCIMSRCEPWRFRQIRNHQKSDLTWKRERVYVSSVLYVWYV